MLTEPIPPDPGMVRYCPAIPFPPYRYVPGLNPHPISDPAGHMYGKPEPEFEEVTPENWWRNKFYLYGIDLFNFAYWWEAHETLEGLWHLAGRGSIEREFLQGLIQSAAALLNRHRGHERGAQRVKNEAVARLRKVLESEGDIFMGVAVAKLIGQLETHFFHQRADPLQRTGSNPPVIELLLPSQ